METKTVIKNGNTTTYQFENGLWVGAVTKIEGGGRVRCTIANPERFEKSVENFYKSQIEKMRLQNDETMKIYEKFSKKRRA